MYELLPNRKLIACSITRQQFPSLVACTATAARLLEFVSGLLDSSDWG